MRTLPIFSGTNNKNQKIINENYKRIIICRKILSGLPVSTHEESRLLEEKFSGIKRLEIAKKKKNMRRRSLISFITPNF
jgi:hypothetical protein